MSTRGAFKVTVTKEDLVFAAAHFITFAGHRCETLHGHNYRTGVIVEGGIDPASWFVLDFAALKGLMRRLTAELDHRVLLPRDNPKLAIAERDGSVHVAFDGHPRYVFPARDCVILPIPNTTVEMLAQYLAGRVRAELSAVQVTAIELEVEENFGQAASYRETLD
jgi:6-pyruvoyltetrahydropterin/6-carboxytetrahydropterin synthase